jgi:hypothetical protein
MRFDNEQTRFLVRFLEGIKNRARIKKEMLVAVPANYQPSPLNVAGHLVPGL